MPHRAGALFSNEMTDLFHQPLPLPAQDHIGRILAAAQHDGRTLLTQLEAFDVLAALAIGHPPVALAKDRREAVSLAKAIGFPVR